MRLDAIDSQHLGVCNSLTATHERLEQHLEPLAAKDFRLESLLLRLGSRLVNVVVRLVNEMVAAHSVGLLHVVSSASDSLV